MNIAPPSVVKPALKAFGPPVFNLAFGVPQFNIGVADGEPGLHPPSNFPYNNAIVLGGMMLFTGATMVSLIMLTALNTIRLFLPWGKPAFASGLLILRAFGAMLFVIMMYLPLVALFHGISQAFIMGAAPSAEQVTSSWGSMFQFGVSLAFVAGTFVELGWDFIKWMGIIHGAAWLYLILMPVVSQPILAIRIYRPHGRIGALCESLLVMWPAIIVSKLFSALLINFALSIDWAANLPGIAAGFITLGAVGLATIMTPLVILIALVSRSRIVRSSLSLGAGAMAGSTLASGARWGKEKLPNTGVKEKASHGAKKAAAKTQSKYWDAKSRAKAGVAAAGGNWKSAAVERAGFKFRDGSSGSGERTASVDKGETLVPTSERVRNLEERAQRTGGATTHQRREWFHRQMEQDGVYGGGDGRTRGRTQSD